MFDNVTAFNQSIGSWNVSAVTNMANLFRYFRGGALVDVETMLQLLEALEMVRDADDDCKMDGLQTIPAPARAKIDAAITTAKETVRLMKTELKQDLVECTYFLKEVAQAVDNRCLIIPQYNLTLTFDYSLINLINFFSRASKLNVASDSRISFDVESIELNELNANEIELGLLLSEFYDYVTEPNENVLLKLVKAKNQKIANTQNSANIQQITALYVEDSQNAMILSEADKYDLNVFCVDLRVRTNNIRSVTLNSQHASVILADGDAFAVSK